MPDMSQVQLPPQVMQLLQQQQQSGGAGIEAMLQQLMNMSPDQVAQAIQQMFGVQVSGDEVEAAAEGWLEQAGDAQASAGSEEADGAGAIETPNANSAPSAPTEEVAEAAPDDEGAEGELPPNAQPTSYSPQRGAPSGGAGLPAGAMAAMQGGGGAMPRSGGPTGPGIPGGSMDDLVSAAMMQSAVGNPNAAVPVGPRSPIPNPRPSGAANNPRMAASIADLYRSTGGKTGKQRTPSAKPAKPSRKDE